MACRKERKIENKETVAWESERGFIHQMIITCTDIGGNGYEKFDFCKHNFFSCVLLIDELWK